MRLRANKFYEKARLAPAIACGPAKFFSSKSLLQRSKDPQDAILYCTELFSKYPNAFYIRKWSLKLKVGRKGCSPLDWHTDHIHVYTLQDKINMISKFISFSSINN